MSDPGFDDLARAYLTEACTTAELAELNQRLRRDASARRRLRKLAREDIAIREALLVGRQATASSARMLPAQPRRRAGRARRIWPPWAVAAMAAMAAGLVAALLLTHRQPAPPPAGPSLAEHKGAWRIGDRPAESGPLAPGSDLRGTGVARLVLADGSQLTLSDGRVRLPDAATGALRLESGSLTVAAQPQDPAAPLRIETPHAEASVVGTRFHLHVSGAGTELQVEDGSVRFADRVRGTVALVAAGGRASAALMAPALPESGPWSPRLARGSAAMPWTPVPGDPTRIELAFTWQPDARWAAIDQELPASSGSELILTLQTIAAAPGAEWSVNGREADGDVWLLAFGPLAGLDRDQPQRIAIRLDQQPPKLLFAGGDGSWSGQAPRVLSIGMARANGRIRAGWPSLAP